MPADTVVSADEALDQADKIQRVLKRWTDYPPLFVIEGIGATPDPWQCDLMDVVASPDPEDDNIAVRACHGVGKTTTLAWIILQYTMLHQRARVPTTAPTFNKQVRDILWSEVHLWYEQMLTRPGAFLARQFKLDTVRLTYLASPSTWFAIGIASLKPGNMEGYHSPNTCVVIDEAKGISQFTFDAVQGMRTTQRAKLVVGSTPGGPTGQFFKIFTPKFRSTWKRLFIVHPLVLKERLRRPEAVGADPDTGKPVVGAYARGGTYFSQRITKEWIDQREKEWGWGSPVFTARAIGDTPELAEDVLIQYSWFVAAESKEDGAAGDETWVSCDVARYGQDRTVALVGKGGTVLHGETIARTPQQSTAPEAHDSSLIGDDPKRPLYRSIPATVEFLVRLRSQWGASGLIVEDTGLSGGVVDELKRRGERVIPINFGSSPTDKPTSPEMAKLRRKRGLPDTYFFNLKAQLGWALRHAFEGGLISLGRLDEALLDPLRAQATLTKYEILQDGRLKLIDPDQLDSTDEWAQLLGEDERRKSPDHFHALLWLWWVCGSAVRIMQPQAKAILESDMHVIGHRANSMANRGLPIASNLSRGVGGPFVHLKGLYRGRPGR